MTVKGWERSPIKGSDLTAETADKAYRAAVAKTKSSAYSQLPPGIYLKRKFGGEWYYLVAARATREIRDYVADNWREFGYSVHVMGQEIYARK